MSKKSGQAAFATKSMFDVLGEDQPEEEEVEEESEDLGVDQAIECVASFHRLRNWSGIIQWAIR